MEQLDVRQEIQRASAALAEPKRLDLVCRLLLGGRTVGELVAETGWPQPLVSHHLAVLRRADLVVARSDGRLHRYSVERAKSPAIRALLDLIETLVHSGDREARPSSGAYGATERFVGARERSAGPAVVAPSGPPGGLPADAPMPSGRSESEAPPLVPIPRPVEIEDFLL